MPDLIICETPECNTEIQASIDNEIKIWECPNCGWKLELEVEENT